MASVGDACAFLADLTLWALFVCTRIIGALAIFATLALGTEHPCAGSHAVSVAAELIGGALFVVAEIVDALAIFATLALGTRCKVAACACEAFAEDAKLVAWAIFVERARTAVDTLAGFAALGLGIGTSHLRAWIVDASGWIADSAVAACGSVARVFGAGGYCCLGIAEFIGSTGRSSLSARIGGAASIDATLSLGASDTCAGFDTFSIGGTADLARSTLFACTRIGVALAFDAHFCCCGTSGRLVGASGGDATACFADILLGAVCIDGARIVHTDAIRLFGTSGWSGVVADLDLKLCVFSGICGGGGPFDFTCRGVDGRARWAFGEFPCVGVACIGVCDGGFVAALFSAGGFGGGGRSDDGRIIDIRDLDFPRCAATSRRSFAVTDFDFKVDLFSSLRIAGCPCDLARLSVDGRSCRGFQQLVCQCVGCVAVGSFDFCRAIRLIFGRRIAR